MASFAPAQAPGHRAPQPRPAPRRAARPRRRAQAAASPRVAGGVLWIVAVAALLAGIVALNVAVLRLNVQASELSRERDSLRAEQAELASTLAARQASARTYSLARRHGYVPADPAETRYLELGEP
jgi:hypothetical protein